MKVITEVGSERNETTKEKTKQLSTFILEGRMYGIDVMQVQEVTKPLPITPIRCAPNFVKGLINLRGQIATAIGVRELFGLSSDDYTTKMTVVCRVDDVLYSMLVDSIGDVLELPDSNFEKVPSTIPRHLAEYIEGVYKVEGSIISMISLRKISEEIARKSAA